MCQHQLMLRIIHIQNFTQCFKKLKCFNLILSNNKCILFKMVSEFCSSRSLPSRKYIFNTLGLTILCVFKASLCPLILRPHVMLMLDKIYQTTATALLYLQYLLKFAMSILIPGKYEVCSIIGFICAKSKTAAEIYHILFLFMAKIF